MSYAIGHRSLLFTAFAIVLGAGIGMGLEAAFAAPTPRELLEIPQVSDLAISPDDQSVVWRQMQASVVRNRSEATWWVAPLGKAGSARQIAEGGDAILSVSGLIVEETPQWSPDSNWVYVRALIDGAVGVWRARADGGAAEAVTHDDADVEGFKLSFDGRSLTYTVGATRAAIVRAENAEYDHGVRLDGTIDPGQALVRGGVTSGRLATQRITGGWFGRSGLLADQPKHEKTVDLTTMGVDAVVDAIPPALVKASPRGSSSLYAQSAASPDGRYVARSAWNGHRARLTVAEAEVPDRICVDIECQGERISALVWRPGTKQILLTTVGSSRRQTLNVWNLSSGRVRRLYASSGLFNGGDVGSKPCAVGPATAVCVEADALSPPRVVAVSLDSGAVRRLADPGAGLAQDKNLIAETMLWTDSHGHPFVGHLLRPKGAQGPLPLVINYYHCDGYLKGGYGDEWPLAPLASAGIATLCIEMAPLTLPQDALAMYKTAAVGIGLIVDNLSARGLIDPRRVCMSGLSFGSEVTMFMAMHTDRLACLSIASPQVSPVYYWMNGLQGRDNHKLLKEVWGLGSPDETPERWKILSPAMDVAAFRVPLLLQLPEQEYRWNMDFLSGLSVSATPNETWVFPDELHIKAQPRHRLAVYTRNIDWFRFWLQGYVDPDPVKTEQYRRWSEKASTAGITPGSGQRVSLQERAQTSASAH
jgi:dipeptidyl aminopeptidase/acylaminoacyl peptidase